MKSGRRKLSELSPGKQLPHAMLESRPLIEMGMQTHERRSSSSSNALDRVTYSEPLIMMDDNIARPIISWALRLPSQRVQRS